MFFRLQDYHVSVTIIFCSICRFVFRNVTRNVLPFHYFFDNGIIGSGTCILSKAPIQDATFHEFSLNGYPHKVFHGDWFAGKGLGVCQLDYKGLNIHVFTSHYHAEYCRSQDIYLGHRVMQALEAAQWIKLTSSGADLTIYAGDFNTEPVDVPYSLLRSVASLYDSWVVATGVSGGGETCGTPGNTYTTSTEIAEYPRGKRIDYVMYRPGPDKVALATHCSLPLPSAIPAPTPVSYSDHEAVAATIHVKDKTGGGGGDTHGYKEHNNKDTTAVAASINLIEKALLETKTDQKLYLIIALVALFLFMASFSQIIISERLVITSCISFIAL